MPRKGKPFGNNRSPKRKRKRTEQNYSGVGVNEKGEKDYSKKVGWKGANHMSSTQSGEGIDWGLIAARIPTAKTKAAKKRRNKMFKEFDVNGNGYLSLAELTKGVRDVLVIP